MPLVIITIPSDMFPFPSFLIFLLVVCAPSLARRTNDDFDLNFEDNDWNDDVDEWEDEKSLEIDDRSLPDYGDYNTREALPFSKTCEIKLHPIMIENSRHFIYNATCEPISHRSRLSRPSSKQNFCIIKHQEHDDSNLCQTEYTTMPIEKFGKETPIVDKIRVGVGCKRCNIGLKYKYS